MVTVEKIDAGGVDTLLPVVHENPFKKYQYIRMIKESAIEAYYRAELARLAGGERTAVFVAYDGGSPVGVLALADLPWDSEMLGVPCGRVFALLVPLDYEKGYAVATALSTAAREWARGKGFRLLDVRCDARDLPAAHALEATGFRMMEASLAFSYTIEMLPSAEPEITSDAEIRLATADDEPFMRRAAAMFRGDRFHRDPRIPKEAANRLYEEWIVNSGLQKRGRLYLAVVRGRPIGLESLVLDDAFNHYSDVKLGSWEITGILPHARASQVWEKLSWEITKDAVKMGLRVGEARTQLYNFTLFNLMRVPPKYARGELTFHGWLD